MTNAMDAINLIPITHKPLAQLAAIRLAAKATSFRRGLPDDPALCAKLIGYRTRTLEKHWEEVKLILATYFSEQ